MESFIFIPVIIYLTFFFFSFRISKNIPTTKDVEPLLEIDADIRNFEVFLSSRTPVLVSRDVKTFLPCTVNLDPKLREIIAGKCQLNDRKKFSSAELCVL